MAAAPVLPLVPVADYLNSGYHPEREFINGVLVERPLPTILHSLLEAILIRFFGQYEREHRFKALPEVRTETVKLSRYRVPDVLLCPVGGAQGKVVNITPLAVIEILSPEDRMGEVMERFRDYAGIGTPLILHMDPEQCTAHRYEDGSLMRTSGETITTPARGLVLNCRAIFEQLISEHAELTIQPTGHPPQPT